MTMAYLPVPLRRLGGVLLFGLVASGCSTDSLTPSRCVGPAVTVTPDRVTFAVGDTVLATAALTGAPECRPISMTLRQLRWRSSDSVIARVSALKGYLVARDTGHAIVTLYLPADSTDWGEIQVTVTP